MTAKGVERLSDAVASTATLVMSDVKCGGLHVYVLAAAHRGPLPGRSEGLEWE